MAGLTFPDHRRVSLWNSLTLAVGSPFVHLRLKPGEKRVHIAIW